MPLFNVYLLGHWVNEVLYLRCNGIEKTCEEVREYVHHMDTHQGPGRDTSDWIDISFYDVVPCCMPEVE